MLAGQAVVGLETFCEVAWAAKCGKQLPMPMRERDGCERKAGKWASCGASAAAGGTRQSTICESAIAAVREPVR
jgi:hypothetical protein